MILRAIQDKFKVKSSLKYLEDELLKSKIPTNRGNGIKAIACIVDMDNFPNAEQFNELRKDFSLAPNAIQIIGYKRGHDKNNPFSIQFFTDKDLGWNGSIENSHVSEFVSREYDVLINYYNEDRLMLKLLSAKVHSRLRVGFVGVDDKINDLMFSTDLKDFSMFRSELKKYLRVLKELE
ncbi:DUF6913 domain-containing protein [Croceitalea rosinachiae]|uniref:Uncharacterized protein n=1 Tax=Croceitalea rosinachiae TaxID=3075596 RepID=A0ABU3AAR2_9FLAO|nr:hypothetical protein [Croceitalea sp. F388]MDT0607270.1 hypothetical protein [Croceitalea sp. F388]